MDTANRCSEYCAADGELQQNKIIVFPNSATELDFELNGDLEAIKVCSTVLDANNNIRYAPDPDCRVCSGEGKCMADGTCKCSPGTTGEYCDIQCNANEDGTVCSGHGRCIRNALDTWFNPFTSKYRCECTPYDTYTSETRQRLLKKNFLVEPPPTPEFYGKHCGFHCPRYNEDVCTGRGGCETGVAVATSKTVIGDRIFPTGSAVFCRDDEECQNIPGSFCARLSTPWDSLMKTSSKSFFSNGPESPGYYTCATSKKCIDSIHSVEWDSFCVNMLNGWYPPVLNTAECVYNEEHACRESIEDFFMDKYDGNDTWCEAAEKKLMPPKTGVCGSESYADKDRFLNDNVPICFEYTMEATCNAQPECIYDQTLKYIRDTDIDCQNDPPCTGYCQDTGNSTCETKTYCRAKTCSDIMFEHNVEKMCLDIDKPCSGNQDWQMFCADAVGKVRTATTLLNSMETFYSCYMYDNRDSPLLISPAVPGGIPINGVLRVFGEDVTVSEYRQSFVDSTVVVPLFCDIADASTFCDLHLKGVVPSWYNNPEMSSGWFLPWLIVCENGPLDVVSSTDSAFKLIAKLGQNCKEHYRTSEIRSDNAWEDSSERAESVIYTGRKWTKQCLNNKDEQLDVIDYSQWSEIPSECTINENKLHQRWGQARWTPDDVQREFSSSCTNGLEASWMPSAVDVPTLCDMDICGAGHTCQLCDSCAASVVYCSKNNLGRAVDCKENNPCLKGAQCFQTPDTLLQSSYYCDVTPQKHTNVTINDITFTGLLSKHGGLTVVGGWNNIASRGTATVEINTILYQLDYKKPAETTAGNAEIEWVHTMPFFETYLPKIGTLSTCVPDINWFRVCSEQTLGMELNTKPSPGLSWTGDATLLAMDRVQFSDIVSPAGSSLEIIVISGGITTICDGISQFWDGNVLISSPFISCRCKGTYGPVLVSSILIDGQQAVRTLLESIQQDETRLWQLPENENSASYKDWFFEDGHLSVNRPRTSTQGTDALKPRGVRWDLKDSHDKMRISGWTRGSDGGVSMHLLNGDNATLLSLKTVGKTIWVNNGQTDCQISDNKWWHWQGDVKFLNETHHVNETAGKIATVFDQQWQTLVFVDGVPCSSVDETDISVRHITTTSVEVKTLSSIAPSFHDIPRKEEHECRAACHGHERCRQWSWTEHDSHCYLHSSRCHEDENCRHGTHLLRSFHSQKIKYFEVSIDLTNVIASWTRLRAEPLLELPSPCDIHDPETIDVRWRSTFKELYEPFVPDVTSTCNQLHTTWQLMPGYKNAVCGETECHYNPHDLKACALWKETAYPEVTDDQCNPTKGFNWTSYCRYRGSFDTISNMVPFLGGLDLGSLSGGVRDLELGGLELDIGMDELCVSSRGILKEMTATCTTPVDVD